MKKINALIIALFIGLGMAHAQDVYVAGNHNGTGKIWKNNSLVYSISDTAAVMLTDMNVANDSTIYSAGYNYSNFRGHIWLNDSVLFMTDTQTLIERIMLNDNGWTAVGENKVWQNGEILYEYSIDSNNVCNLYALAVDDTTGDVYAGGSIVTPGVYACVWKNDTILWQCAGWSKVNDLCFDGDNLYAAGFIYGAESIDGVVWQNDSIIFQIEGGDIIEITAYNESLYWAGVSSSDNTAHIWQDGEVLYSHADANITALYVNEYGVFYAGIIDGIATVWKDGEVLYELADCESICDLAVMPSEPEPTYTLTVLADSTAWGNVTGGGNYHYGDTVTIEAIPAMGHTFLFWNDSIATNPRDVIITQDTTFVAHFGLQQCVINTEVVPEGAGIVTGGGPAAYLYGDIITLEAIPNGGYAFEMWNDSVTTNPREIMVTQDSTFTAFFVERQYTITVESDHPAWGSVTGGGTFNYGDTIQIAATPNLGFAFAGWTDGIYTNPRTVVVTEDATYTAHFEIRQCTISTAVTPEGAGTVNGGGSFNYGETIRLTAHSNTGYVFDVWDDGEITNPRNVFVEGDATYTAVFTPLNYEITTACEPENGGTVTGGGTYPYGSTATLTATANEGFMFISWNDGIVRNPREINVTGNATYKAIFHQNGTPTYTITVLSSNALLGSVTGGGEYPEGSTIEISARPTNVAVFTGWDDGNTDNPRTIVVTGNATYTANFEIAENYTITVVSDNPQGGSVYGGGSYAVGSTVSIGATAFSGYHFTGWHDGNLDNPRSIVVTGNATYTASFAQTPVPSYTITVQYDENQGYVLGAGDYVAGSTATLVAIPNDGYYFVKWGDGTTDNRKEILVDRDITIAAFFNGTSVDENGMANVVLYPNPANDMLRIEGLEGTCEVKIYNAYGLLVKTANADGDTEIDINDLVSGIYLIQFDGGHSMKFVKR